MIVVADTGPLNYLVLIGVIEILPALLGRVTLPDAVRAELEHPRAPIAVRQWIANPPDWVDFAVSPPFEDFAGPAIGFGERAVIAIASTLHADLILMDDRRAATAARALGLRALGTLGLLDRAALKGLADLPSTVAKLRATNFRCRPEVLDALLRDHAARSP